MGDLVMPPEVRAEVLRVMLALTTGAATLGPAEAAPLAELDARDLGVLDAHSADDLALLNACLAVEHELREREFVALERLLALAQWDDGPLDARVLALPRRQFAQAALCMIELGWLATRHSP